MKERWKGKMESILIRRKEIKVERDEREKVRN